MSAVMSTGKEVTEDSAAVSRQPCDEAACCTTFRTSQQDDNSNSQGKCCDESCLAKIALHECTKNKCGDAPDSIEHLQRLDDSVRVEIKSNDQPCKQHSMETRSRYSAMLDNLGCICNILLSLNIEPCCVIPSHASTRSVRGRSRITQGIRNSSGSSISGESVARTSEVCKSSYPDKENCGSTVPNLVATASSQKEIKKTGCCSTDISPGTDSWGTMAQTAARGTVPDVDNIIRSCCGTKSNMTAQPAVQDTVINAVEESPIVSTSTVLKIPSTGADDCSKKSCCSGQISNPVSRDDVSNGFAERSCIIQPDVAASAAGADSRPEHGCCGDGASRPTGVAKFSDAGDCSKKTCCTSKGMASRVSSLEDMNIQPVKTMPVTAAASLLSTAPVTRNEKLDEEKGGFEVEHLILSVQGMTCVGCEKKLHRSLTSLPAISNIKTSLILAQAEFDLNSSLSVNGNNIIKVIERMTGFICAKMTQLGNDLDIIVDGNVLELSGSKDLPLGVTNLTFLDKTTIRVTYNPKAIGARALLSDPFFPNARLAPVPVRPMIASGRAHVRVAFYMTLLSALLTLPVLVLAWAPLPKREVLYGAISLGFATIVQTVVAAPFYTNALKALVFSRMIEMDLLIVLSTTTAYTYSIIAYGYLAAGRPLLTGQFFETSTLLVTLIMVGRTVSAYARQKAVESISVESLQTSTALLINCETPGEQEIDARLLQYQDTFKVLPDTSIVTDGVVITGETEVDESMITGEAMLISKKPGMAVVAGSINHSGILTVRLTRLPYENTIQTIGSMVDEAKSSKPKIQETADRVASMFVPVILIVTVLIFVIWIAIGIAVRHGNAATASIVAMTYAISALIVSCPCAIGLAVPMVVVIAGGVAAKHGVIFQSAETIEIARKISHVIFDKTGTLTQGKLSVTTEHYPVDQSETFAPMIFALTSNSKHPVSAALAAHMKSLKIQPALVKDVVSVAGNGIEGTWNGSRIRAGNPHWLGVEALPAIQQTLSQGLTMFCVTIDERLVAVFGLEDILRPDALQVIEQLKKRAIAVSIVSGDNEAAVQSVANRLGVPPGHVRFRCSPGDKQMYVKEMLARKNSIVMFCGDGTNDAAALAQASIGMHMNEGTDIAQSAADAVLMRPSLSGILILMDLSKAFNRRVLFNFLWSFLYNIFAILLAAGAFPNVRIPPQFAGLGEIVSVVPVIVIAMQLKWERFGR